MMEMCCSPKTAGTKEETVLQKEQEREMDSTKEGCGCS